MDARRRMLALIAVFLGLLALHFFLLWRTIGRGDYVLSSLLAFAIAMFLWRIHVYARRYLATTAETKAPKDPAAERRQIRTMAPLLVGLLVLHAWLISVTVAQGEYLFAALLVLAVVVFVTRLAVYAKRYRALRSA